MPRFGRFALASCVLFLSSVAEAGAAKKVKNPVPPADKPVIVKAELLSLDRSTDATYRYWGRLRLSAPKKYRGRETDCFLLSHDRDLRKLIGKKIEIATAENQLEPELDRVHLPGISDQSRIEAEDVAGRFQDLSPKHENVTVPVSAHVIRYDSDPEQRLSYAIDDQIFHGDLATVEVDAPARFHSTRLRVLLQTPGGTASKWSELGAGLTFSVSEAVLEWEPGGFTFVEDLKDVQFQEVTRSPPAAAADPAAHSP